MSRRGSKQRPVPAVIRFWWRRVQVDGLLESIVNAFREPEYVFGFSVTNSGQKKKTFHVIVEDEDSDAVWDDVMVLDPAEHIAFGGDWGDCDDWFDHPALLNDYTVVVKSEGYRTLVRDFDPEDFTDM